MNKKIFLAAACCLPLGLMAQKGFTIKGKVGALNTPAIAYLNYSDEGKKVVDSAILNNGQFSFKGKLNSPAQAYITLKHDTITKPRHAAEDYLSLYIENSDITVTAKDSVSKALVKGSATNDDDHALRALQRPYKRVADSIMAVYNAKTPAEKKDSVFLASLRPRMRWSQEKYDSTNSAFIAAHPNSYISLLTFQQVEVAYNFNPDTAAARFEKFPASLRESATGKKIAAVIETGRKTNTGVMAMDFTEMDTTGVPVKLSDYRGKYVLVDFWASWCKPCRAENPNLLKAYNKFKSKNFTILGVSLDDADGRRAWLHAVKQDGLPWTQVSELKGFQAKSAVLYGVSAIPTNFLIDPSGKIIARNLRGEELDKKLASLL